MSHYDEYRLKDAIAENKRAEHRKQDAMSRKRSINRLIIKQMLDSVSKFVK
ncbi:MAG: hypothetical protein ACPHUL_00105 [Marinomonas gallaica]